MLRRNSFLALCALLVACGPRVAERRVGAEGNAAKLPRTDSPYRRPGMPWWHGISPECSAGELKSAHVSWGALYWCELEGHAVDTALHNDVGRVARCIHDSVALLGEGPIVSNLGTFLNSAVQKGVTPSACGAIRQGAEVLTYNGRSIDLDRVLVAPAADDGRSEVRYRVSCDGCLVASETTVKVKL